MQIKVRPGFEPRSEESESSVITNYTNRPSGDMLRDTRVHVRAGVASVLREMHGWGGAPRYFLPRPRGRTSCTARCRAIRHYSPSERGLGPYRGREVPTLPTLPNGGGWDGGPIADTLIRRASAVVNGLRRVSDSAWVYPSCGVGAGLG